MPDLFPLIADEKHAIENVPLSYATKAGQVYCYLSSGPVPMIKIGKGKNGRQRMASWIQEYPPSWRDGDVVFIIDKMNQSKGESAFHRFFSAQRIPSYLMREVLGIEEWQRLPDGASEWFYCDPFVINSFKTVGIDLVALYQNHTGRDLKKEHIRSKGLLYRATRFFRQTLATIALTATTAFMVMSWGSWILFSIIVILGFFVAGFIYPND